MSLTPKQEAFAQAVASGMTQADAYRSAYNADKMKPETIQNSAYKLMQDGDITARIEELRAPIAAKAQITLESHLDDLLRLRRMAEDNNDIKAAISAEIARGKAAGIIVDKKEITGKNGGPIEQKTSVAIDSTKEWLNDTISRINAANRQTD
jgi:phage terminase small subunit